MCIKEFHRISKIGFAADQWLTPAWSIKCNSYNSEDFFNVDEMGQCYLTALDHYMIFKLTLLLQGERLRR
jgi:hypothetical protein